MQGEWQTTDLAGHAVEIFTPPERRTDAVLLVLPNYESVASHSEGLTAALERLAVPAVAPRSERCWWLDRVEPDFDLELPPLRYLTEHVVPLIDDRFGVPPPGVKLLGSGVGGQGVLQLAFRRPREFPAVAAIDPAIDFHDLHGRGTAIDALFPTREAARQETAILRLHPAGWPRWMMLIADRNGFWFEGAEKLDMKLRSMGIPIESELTHSCGGGAAFFEKQVDRALRFLLTERVTLPVIRRQE